jgi:hypothetical protein
MPETRLFGTAALDLAKELSELDGKGIPKVGVCVHRTVVGRHRLRDRLLLQGTYI